MFFRVVSYYAQKYKVYPTEVFFIITMRILKLSFLYWFWGIIFGSFNFWVIKGKFAYFVLASAVADIITLPGQTPHSMGRFLRKAIKSGEFSNYVLMPFNIIKYSYAMSLGRGIIRIIIGFVQLVIGLWMLDSLSIYKLVLFVIFLTLAFALSFAFNMFEASLAFFFTEIGGLKNALLHITRVFSGKFLPLQMFPGVWMYIAMLSPFAGMIYWPIAVLSKDFNNIFLFKVFSIMLFEAIIFNFIFFKLWQQGQKQYEAIGL